MERVKKQKTHSMAAAPMSPEAQARLANQVSGLVAALEAGADLPALKEYLIPDPQDPQWDVQLMAALGALPYPAIPALLAALFGEAKDKFRRKALKKTLHLLKTRGVTVPEDLLPREEASLGAPRSGTAMAYGSPIFGNGESYIILEGSPEILRGNFLVSRISDLEGFRECVLLNLKRKQQAEFWEHFREQGVEDFFSPPPAFAVSLLEAAYTAHSDSPGASQYGALREKIFQHWGRPETAPDLEGILPAANPGEKARLLEESRKLALDPLFHSWLPGPEEITPWLTKLQEVQDSPLVLSDQQKQVRIDAVLEEATRSLYSPETRSGWSRRLMIMAYYLHLQGRQEDSRAAKVAAIDLVDSARSTLHGENLFLKALVQFALRLAWEAQQPRETTTPSGLVAPSSDGLLIRR
ncbi:MAG: hypothetical protein ACOZFS_05070 [Thermodesulfobacteriota bacterium]